MTVLSSRPSARWCTANPSAVKAMFTQNDNGSITVSFGDGHSIKIAHVTDADIAIWSSAGTNGLWLTVLEKAYRRILLRTQRPNHQDNSDIYEKFNSAHTIEILDGHQTRKVELHNIRPGTSAIGRPAQRFECCPARTPLGEGWNARWQKNSRHNSRPRLRHPRL